ncbi:MAG: IscS subfamily cysteine desulfurase [Actinobacteria bacterium]|nr:IscS subfamily cysteine desulfurase [Actinomycetota bacterium]
MRRDTICGICPAGCWVTAELKDGRLVSVEAQQDTPLGMICKLGEHSPEMVYSPHRLQYPMRRTGPRGSGRFGRITWDEAMETIASRLKQTREEHGAEACGIYTGRGSFDLALCDVFQPKDTAVSSASSVLFPFGSPNTFGVGALCYVSYAMIAPHVTMGGMLINMDSELEQAELIVVWGANPATDSPPMAHKQIMEARQRGAEVVVIDPRRNGTARECGAEWVPIRPGTDGALALSMIEVLIEEDLYDEQFVNEWTVGFEELSRYVQHFRPEAVEEITWVPAGTIRSLARRIAGARGASPVMYTGLEYSDSGVQAIRATMVLWALAGQLDVPGGRVFRMRENAFPVNRNGLVANPAVKRAIGRDRFPVYSKYRGESHAISLPEAVLEERPYPIKSLLVLGGSIITSWPQPDIWRRTLESLDFLVTIDRQLTADSAYADIVLPATTGFENTSYMTYGSMFRIRERLIEPVGEARNDLLILGELAGRLGYGEFYPQSEEELLEHVLHGSGFTPDDVRAAGGSVSVPSVMMQYKKWQKGGLRADGQPGFETPSGKFEIASSILEEHGYEPLPAYTEPREGPLASPELAGEYPLVFNSGARVRTDFRSQHHGVYSLASAAPEPQVTINSIDAAERGISGGDEVIVATPRGQLRFRAFVTDNIVRGAIDANMGGGGPVGPEAWRDCNVNGLTDLQRYDPISGFPVYKSLLCDVMPVKAAGRASAAGRRRSRAGLDTAIASARTGSARTGSSGSGSSGSAGRDPANERASRKRALKQTGPSIYLDHNATTPIDPEVVEAMLPFLKDRFGNPSSIHTAGASAREALDGARRSLAQTINCTARRVIFTGSGSEADNLAVKGMAFAAGSGHIITSAIEHPAILASCRSLEKFGFDITYLPVGAGGIVNPRSLDSAIRNDTILVSVMLANNETGAIQPIADLAAIARERGVPFHCDAVQALGKIPVDVEELGVDMLSVSGHKIHAPKGVGALFVRRGIRLEPLIDGGNQEDRRRAGTENVAAIAGFARAAEQAVKRLPDMQRVAGLRDRLQQGLTELVEGARVNGDQARRLPNTLNMTLPGLRGESLVLRLDRMGIALSSGSACKSGSPDPSHALLALGLPADDAHCSVRFSLGQGNTEDEIEQVLRALSEVIQESMSAIRFVPCR